MNEVNDDLDYQEAAEVKSFNHYRKDVLVVILIIVAIGAVAYFALRNTSSSTLPEEISIETPVVQEDSFNIEIEEKIENTSAYNIEYSVLSGNPVVTKLVNDNIKQIVSDFKNQADLDREQAVAEFGELPEYLTRPYALQINAEKILSDNYSGILLTEYYYTGGANGTGLYKTYLFDTNLELIEDIKEVIDSNEIQSFEQFVVRYLEEYRFGDDENAVKGADILFKESLDNFDIDTIDGFLIDNRDLRLFFSEYSIGPGVLGQVEVKIHLNQLGELLKD